VKPGRYVKPDATIADPVPPAQTFPDIYSDDTGTPIQMSVNEAMWTFVRGEDDSQRLTIRRAFEEGDESASLTVTLDGSTRSYNFPDVSAAMRFQADMEAFLLKSGWSFIEFAPERRSGSDRRRAPRLLPDRRRWWTDGMVTLKQFLESDE
jgi:hypothetical protein